MKLKSPYLVKPDGKLKLSSLKTESTGDLKDREAASAHLAEDQKRLAGLQEVLYASQEKAVLIVPSLPAASRSALTWL